MCGIYDPIHPPWRSRPGRGGGTNPKTANVSCNTNCLSYIGFTKKDGGFCKCPQDNVWKIAPNAIITPASTPNMFRSRRDAKSMKLIIPTKHPYN